ncbi:MAG: hypothetical protein WC589_21920 [Sphingobacterium sp.]
MKIKFIYSIESEWSRVHDAYKRKEHFLNYNYKVRLPKGFSLENSDLKNLKSQIEKEINNPFVDDAKTNIADNWTRYQSKITKLIDSIGGRMPAEIDIVLTKYGVGGSYWPPQKVIVNVHYPKYFENFVHELIHCCIEESIIKKYRLNHQQKEGIIDWIFLNSPFLKTIFPDYSQQRMSILPTEELINNTNLGFQES